MSRIVRYRMAETGEKYTKALKAIRDIPGESHRIREAIRMQTRRQRYPFTDRDGLDGRHLLSGWETSRRSH